MLLLVVDQYVKTAIVVVEGIDAHSSPDHLVDISGTVQPYRRPTGWVWGIGKVPGLARNAVQ
jgi:GTP cyclohydrolase I